MALSIQLSHVIEEREMDDCLREREGLGGGRNEREREGGKKYNALPLYQE